MGILKCFYWILWLHIEFSVSIVFMVLYRPNHASNVRELLNFMRLFLSPLSHFIFFVVLFFIDFLMRTTSMRPAHAHIALEMPMQLGVFRTDMPDKAFIYYFSEQIIISWCADVRPLAGICCSIECEFICWVFQLERCVQIACVHRCHIVWIRMHVSRLFGTSLSPPNINIVVSSANSINIVLLVCCMTVSDCRVLGPAQTSTSE